MRQHGPDQHEPASASGQVLVLGADSQGAEKSARIGAEVFPGKRFDLPTFVEEVGRPLRR